MTTEQEEQLIPFITQGDADTFENKYLPTLLEMGITDNNSRKILTSIWVFANKQWSKGYDCGADSGDY